jgi:hypothetical protein
MWIQPWNKKIQFGNIKCTMAVLTDYNICAHKYNIRRSKYNIRILKAKKKTEYLFLECPKK